MPNRLIVAREMAAFLKVMGHPDRIRIVQLLSRGGEHDVTDIAGRLGLPATRVSQHLALLRAHRLAEETPRGRRRLYRLAAPALAAWLIDGLDFVIERFGELSAEQAADAARLWRPGPEIEARDGAAAQARETTSDSRGFAERPQDADAAG